MDRGFALLEQIIRTTALRHKVLASNIANVDTPGYKAKDVHFKDVLNTHSIQLAKTNPLHIQGISGLKEAGGTTVEERASWEDGNNVAMDMEMANMTENGLLYNAGVQLLTKKFQIYKNIIKGQ